MKKLLLPFVMFLLFAPNTYAQGIDIGIYPPILQIQAERPASINAQIVVKNNSDQNASYSISYVPFQAGSSTNGQPHYDKSLEPEYRSLFAKTQILDGTSAIREVNLAPLQEKTLNLHIGLTQQDRDGDYYFSVVFTSSQSTDSENSSFTGARGGIATNVLLSVGKPAKPEGLIEKFSGPHFVTKGPVDFKLNLANIGSNYFQARGNVLVKNMFGQTIGNVELLPINVLSESIRSASSKENGLSDPKVRWNEKFLLGFYTAEASIALSDEGPIIKKQLTFFALPAEAIGGILVALVLVVGIIKRVRQKSQEIS